MKLFELTDTNFSSGYYDPMEDKVNQRIPTDTRKPILTLKHLNRLKKIRAIQKLDNLKRIDTLKLIYGNGAGEQGGMGSF